MDQMSRPVLLLFRGLEVLFWFLSSGFFALSIVFILYQLVVLFIPYWWSRMTNTSFQFPEYFFRVYGDSVTALSFEHYGYLISATAVCVIAACTVIPNHPWTVNLKNKSDYSHFLVFLPFSLSHYMSSIGGAISSSLISSIGVKLVSFFVSTLIVRSSSSVDFGKISVNFQLVVSLSLFLLKEGVRRSAIRCTSPSEGRVMIWIGHAITSLVFIPAVVFIYMHFFENESVLVQLLLAVSLWFESFAEIVLFEQGIAKNLSVRNIADTWAALLSSLALYLALVSFENASIAFVISHNVFSLLLLILSSRGLHLFQIIKNAPLQDIIPSLGKTAIIAPLTEMSVMSIQKLFLTEGERMLTLAFIPPNSVGQLALVNNAGSLVLRIFFAPIEDIAFTAFAKSRAQERLPVLKSVLLVQVSIALFGIAFGIPASESVIYLLYGKDWASQTSVVYMLQLYCFLLLAFALNGALEAYFFAVATSKQLRWALVSQWVVFLSMVSTVFATSSLGAISILIGNGVSMIVRIAWCFTVFDSLSDPFHALFLRVGSRISIGGIVCHIAIVLSSEILSTDGSVKTHLCKIGIAGLIASVTIVAIFANVRGAISELKKTQ